MYFKFDPRGFFLNIEDYTRSRYSWDAVVIYCENNKKVFIYSVSNFRNVEEGDIQI